MPLHPHAKRFLDMAAAGGMPAASRVTPDEMRAAFLRLTQAIGGRHEPVARIEDRTIPGPAGALPVRIYTPATAGARSAGIVFFHGGGWVFGNLDSHEGFCRVLANETHARVIAVDYRLAPEHKFPAAIEDARAGTAWVAENAAALGIDADRLAIAGDSAGGNLAAVMCQLARASGPKLALQALFCPVMDMSGETPSREAFAEGYFLDRATFDWSLGHYSDAGADRRNPLISPVHAADVSGLPPAHIHTAEFDPVRDEGKAYAERLERAGVPVHYTCHAGMIHHFYGMAAVIPSARTAMAAAGAAIRAALE